MMPELVHGGDPLLPLLYTNARAAALFLAACLIWNVPELFGMFKQTAQASRKDASIQDRGSMFFLIALQWLGLALNFALAGLWRAAAIPWQRTPLFLLGVFAILLGTALRWYAIWTLGNYFTRDVAVSTDQPVVQHGVYRAIRHPSYSGTFLTMLGVGLAVTNWASLVALLTCVFLGHLYRVQVEEQALIQTIGQPYVAYMRRTKRFIPWLV
jgi:protein-S-isoprenylcysteine O-methyltransferase Ste14